MSDGDGSPGKPSAIPPVAAAVEPVPSEAKSASASPDETSPRDRLLVHSRSDHGYRVLRQRGDNIELGELRDLQDGKPISGEMVSLSPTEHERVFDVETVHAPPERRGKGPPMVASSTYRAGWDAIFGADGPDSAPSEVDPKSLN